MLVVNERFRIPLRELRFTFSRSSGAGGQNVNKVNTKATLHWNLRRTRSLPSDVRTRLLARYSRRVNAAGELLVRSQRFRDQARNVADCLEKLRDLLASVASAPRRRRPTRPSRASVERRLSQKRSQGDLKKQRRPPRPDTD